jgi:hypothetical protein
MSALTFSSDPAANQWAFWRFLEAKADIKEDDAESIPDNEWTPAQPARPFSPESFIVHPWAGEIDAIRDLLNEVEAGTPFEKLVGTRKLFTMLLEPAFQRFIRAHPKFQDALLDKIEELRGHPNGHMLEELMALLEHKIAAQRPLSWWQEFLQHTGRLLTNNSVQLHPGAAAASEDIRLLAVFCSVVYRTAPEKPADWQILNLAATWHEFGGRAGLETEAARAAWYAAAAI